MYLFCRENESTSSTTSLVFTAPLPLSIFCFPVPYLKYSIFNAKLPNFELTKFNGAYAEWLPFWDEF